MAATVAELAASVAVEGVAQAEAGLASFGSSVDAAGKKQGSAAAESAKHDAAMQKVGNSALVMGGLITAGVGIAIGTTVNFDKALSGVAAVSNATSGEMNKLRTAAIDAGQATSFSASESATAEAELAKAGLSVSQILGGGLKGSLDLAAAGQLDLATAATITAQALNIFKLDGSQASHVADVLAAGANKSAADVKSLGEGLGNVGGVAHRAGVSLEETVGVLSLFADNALDGAEGGTALKSMLIALQAPSTEAKTRMKELGINAYDASGNFVGLARFAGNLREAMSGLTPEVRDAAMATIFGSYGIRAAGILYEGGAGKVREYTKAVNDQGAAGRMAGVQMDNLAGDIEQLSGSIETGLITSASGGTSVLRILTQTATDMVNGWSQLDPVIQQSLSGLIAFSGAGLLAVGAGIKFSAMLSEWSTAAGNINPMLSGAVTGLGKLAGAAAIAGVSLSLIDSHSEKSVIGIAGLAVSGALLGSTFGPVGTAVGGAAGALAGLTAVLLDGTAGVKEYREGFAKLGTEIGGLTASQSLKQFWDALGQGDRVKLFDGAPWVTTLDGIKAAAEAAGPGVKVNIGAIRDELNAMGKTNPAGVALVVDALKDLHREDGKPLLTGKALSDLYGIMVGVNSKYKESAGQANEMATANQLLGDSATQGGEQVSSLATALDTAKNAAGNFKTAIDSLFGAGLGVEAANLKWRDSIDGINASLEKNGMTLDINTEQGRNNREALLGSTTAALALAQAQFEASGGMDQANATIGLQISQLYNSALAAGLSEQAALDYTGTLLGIPPEAMTNIHNTGDLARYVAEQAEAKYKDLQNMSPVNTDLTAKDAASAVAFGVVGAVNIVPRLWNTWLSGDDGTSGPASNARGAVTAVPNVWHTRFDGDSSGIEAAAARARSAMASLQGADLAAAQYAGAAYGVRGAHGLVGLARGGSAGMIVGPNQPVVIGEGLSREAVVPFDHFGDMVATIRNTGRASDFARASYAAGADRGQTSGGGVTVVVVQSMDEAMGLVPSDARAQVRSKMFLATGSTR